ncbi:MAG TPA: hypothetical protein ACQGQI_00860 [Xylella sp.]
MTGKDWLSVDMNKNGLKISSFFFGWCSEPYICDSSSFLCLKKFLTTLKGNKMILMIGTRILFIES